LVGNLTAQEERAYGKHGTRSRLPLNKHQPVDPEWCSSYLFFRERAWKSVYSCNQIRIKSIAAAVGGSAVASAFNSLLTERILKGDKALCFGFLMEGS
jgi:hypothetical protein